MHCLLRWCFCWVTLSSVVIEILFAITVIAVMAVYNLSVLGSFLYDSEVRFACKEKLPVLGMGDIIVTGMHPLCYWRHWFMICAFYVEQVIMTYISADCRQLQTDRSIEAVLACVRVDYCSICGIQYLYITIVFSR